MSTPESKYWLGFLYADGCVHETEIILSLAGKDLRHIEKYKQFLDADNVIGQSVVKERSFRGNTLPALRCARLAVGDVTLSSTLYAIGIRNGQRSCNSVVLRESADFWRGVVDGDGWVRTQKYKHLNASKPIIGLCGSFSTVSGFIKWARSVCPKIHARPARDRSIWKCEFAADIAAQLIRALYADAVVSLDRKQAAADAVMGSWVPQCDRGVLVRLPNGRYAAA